MQNIHLYITQSVDGKDRQLSVTDEQNVLFIPSDYMHLGHCGLADITGRGRDYNPHSWDIFPSGLIAPGHRVAYIPRPVDDDSTPAYYIRPATVLCSTVLPKHTFNELSAKFELQQTHRTLLQFLDNFLHP